MPIWQSACLHGLAILLAGSVAIQAADREGTDYFERNVRPVLVEQCHACHSGRISAPQAGLRVDSLDALLEGGSSGPALVPGDPERSLLVRVLRHVDRVKMPPTGKLTHAQVDRIAAWIRMGAPYPASEKTESARGSRDSRHWAFVPPREMEPPISANGRAKTAIDRFIEARLESAGLNPSPEAHPGTLVRRLHYDLTGLPPGLGESDAFVRSPTPGAFEALADPLLA